MTTPTWWREKSWYIMCLSVTSHIVDLWQYCELFIRSVATRCILIMVLYLCRTCLGGLHAVLWSHIDTLMCLLVAEPRSTAEDFYSHLSIFFE